jgi:sarcosine oxidase delta subunit
LAVEDRNFSVYITTNHKTCFNENWIHTSQCKSNTLLSLRHLNVQEDVNMKYIHTTDGRQVNLHNAYSTYDELVDL